MILQWLMVFVMTTSASPKQDAGASGGLSPNVIRTVVLSHVAEIRMCYEAERSRHPDLKGEITAAWTIGNGGVVTSASIVRSTMNNANVESCLVREISTWRFTPAAVPTNVAAYPFKFGTR